MDETTGQSDSALLERFAGGDVPAYERLVARYEKRVFNFILRTIGPSDEAEDLTQETFIRAYEQARTLKSRDAFRPWLWSIAANLCRDHFKRRRYRNNLSIEDGVGTDWIRSCEIHDGPEPKTHQTFAFGARKGLQFGSDEERAELRRVAESMEYRDGWGRVLPVTVEETENGWTYRVAFDTPVFPGEPFELICKKVWPRWSRKEGDEWVRRHYIRPDPGTLVSVAIRLPEGAKYTHMEPDPLWRMALNGRELAGWRRYVAAGEVFMPVVRYRLK